MSNRDDLPAEDRLRIEKTLARLDYQIQMLTPFPMCQRLYRLVDQMRAALDPTPSELAQIMAANRSAEAAKRPRLFD
jgi:hypothetical protein